MIVPVADPRAENAQLADELDAAIRRVVSSGTYVLGPEVTAFEQEFAEFVGTRFAVGVASGTDALTLALHALGVGTGDEVLTASHTAGATAAAILRAGATPALVDVDPATLTVAPSALERALTARTRAVVPVHLYGGAADLAPIQEFAGRHGLVVIEDCAQAHGTTYRGEHVGSTSDAAAFSFYPTKNLAALGDGGAVVTSRSDVAERLISLRQYGWRNPQISEELGWNSRLDELQAAVLRVKLRHLPRLVSARRAIAAVYSAEIRAPEVTRPYAYDGVTHSFHLYVVRASHRDALADHLRRRGVATALHYPVPIHRQPAYSALCTSHAMPETERAAAEILTLPLFAAMSSEAIDQVVDAINSFSDSLTKVSG
jgi:dTDP-4-amino-4,6-dideoxygalactose transaminase